MPKFNPKQQQEVKDVVAPINQAMQQPVWGIVLWYESTRNVANVLAAQPGSDAMGEIYRNVPCPVQVGVQGVAPEVGRACLLTFKGDYPIITSFFNYAYDTQDYPRNTTAVQAIPSFMMEM